MTETWVWTPENTALLTRLWNEGLSASAVARRLGHGVTRCAVIGKVHRIGLAKRAKDLGRGYINRKKAVPHREKPVTAVARPVTLASTAPKTVARARPVIAPPAPPVADGSIGVMQLTARTCRWPIGDPGQPGFHFCGHEPRDGAPYCAYHASIAYTAPPKRLANHFQMGRRVNARLIGMH